MRAVAAVDVVDLLALASHHERERATDAGIHLDAQHLLVAQPRTEHETPDHGRSEPGVEHALGRGVEAARDRHGGGFVGRHRGLLMCSLLLRVGQQRLECIEPFVPESLVEAQP